MFPVACFRPKHKDSVKSFRHMLGNVMGTGEKSWTNVAVSSTEIFAQPFVSIAGLIVDIRVKMSASCNAKAAIYEDNGGVPSALVAESNSTACVAGWNVLPLTSSKPLTASTTYWIAIKVSITSRVLLDISVLGTSKYLSSITYDDAFPSTWPGGESDFAFDMALCGWGYA